MPQIAENIAVLEKFGEKLGAVRHSMTVQEQAVLDKIIENTEFDVESHGLIIRPKSVNASLVNFGVAVENAPADDIEDVQAHGVTVGIVVEQTMAVEKNVRMNFVLKNNAAYELTEEDDGLDVAAHGVVS